MIFTEPQKKLLKTLIELEQSRPAFDRLLLFKERQLLGYFKTYIDNDIIYYTPDDQDKLNIIRSKYILYKQ